MDNCLMGSTVPPAAAAAASPLLLLLRCLPAVFQRLLQPQALQPFKQVSITFSQEPGSRPQQPSPPSNGNGSIAGSSSGAISSGDVRTVTADLLMLAAGNSRQMGRRLNVCPHALLDDGLLDFTLLTGDSLAKQVRRVGGLKVCPCVRGETCNVAECVVEWSWLVAGNTSRRTDIMVGVS
jgi:hypothetical protein